MTILDALSWMEKGDKSLRPDLERAFNVGGYWQDCRNF